MPRRPRSVGGFGVVLGLWAGLASTDAMAQGRPLAGGGVPVIANRDSKIYHRTTCASALRLLARNRVELPGAAAAEAQGFTACAQCRPDEAAAEAPAAADDGALKFARDIAPIFVAHCVGCHNPQGRAGKRFDLSTFRKLKAGSALTGEVILPGDPESSELVLRIKGESDGRKMPANNTDLAPETIAKVEAWVKAGALLDAGHDANALLSTYAAKPEDLRKAARTKLTPEQLDQQLAEVARERWKKASPATPPEQTASPHFLLFGTLPKARAEQTLKVLESQYTGLRGLLSVPGQPALDRPEKVSVYVFNEANQYAEFVRSVLSQEVEEGDMARANLADEAPFLVAADPLNGRADPAPGSRTTAKAKREEESTGPERSLAGLLTEQLTIAATIGAGKPPRWLSLGLGAYMGSLVEPRSPYYRRLRASALQQARLDWIPAATLVLQDGADEATARALGFSLVEWLATSYRPYFPGFVRGMLAGARHIDQGILTYWGTTRLEFLPTWGQWVATRYGRGR